MGVVEKYREIIRLSPADKRAIRKKNWRVINERRLFLIDKEHHGDDLTVLEATELEHLQELAGVYRGRRMWAEWKALDEIDVLLSVIKE